MNTGKKISNRKCLVGIVLILLLALFVSYMGNITGYFMLITALLAFVKLVPACRKRENLWMFFLVALCGIPVNVSLIVKYIFITSLPLGLLLNLLIFLAILSVEEIVMGYITRILWRRQYRLPY